MNIDLLRYLWGTDRIVFSLVMARAATHLTP